MPRQPIRPCTASRSERRIAAAPPLWLLSNPIYVARRDGRRPCHPRGRRPRDAKALFDEREAAGGRTETDPTSLAAFDVLRGTTRSRARLPLRPGHRRHHAISSRRSASSRLMASQPYDRLTFEAAPKRPMRISVQVACAGQPGLPGALGAIGIPRADGPSDLGLLRRHDADRRHADVPAAAARTSAASCSPSTGRTPQAGTSGRIWLRNVRLER